MVEITNSHEDGVFTKRFFISVNNKRVEIDEPLVTGLEIK